MDISSFVVSQLSLFAWREGERLTPGSNEAKLAIAFIISNRVKAGWGNSDWLQVLEDVATHSASEKEEMLTFDQPDPWDPDWRLLSAAARGIYDGTMKDDLTWTPNARSLAANVPGADTGKQNQSRPSFFYANLNMPIRSWFLEKVIRKSDDHPRIGSIASSLVLFG